MYNILLKSKRFTIGNVNRCPETLLLWRFVSKLFILSVQRFMWDLLNVITAMFCFATSFVTSETVIVETIKKHSFEENTINIFILCNKIIQLMFSLHSMKTFLVLF